MSTTCVGKETRAWQIRNAYQQEDTNHSMHTSCHMNSLIGKHLVDAADLITGGNDEGDHGRAISSGRLQILDELLHLEDLDLCGAVGCE